MRTRRRSALSLVLMALFLAAACKQKPKPVLRVSQPTSRPMGYQDALGKPRGFVVEAMEAAARRSGITLQWVVVGNIQANNESLRRGGIDVITGIDTPERRREFFVTEPWWSTGLTILVPGDSPLRDAAGLKDVLQGRLLAIPRGAGDELARTFGASRLMPVQSATGVADAVCAGTASAGIIAAMYLPELLLHHASACAAVGLRAIDADARLDYVLVARPALADTVRDLRASLDTITSDGTLAAIASRNPPVSTPHATRLSEVLRTRYQRQIAWLSAAASVFILLLAAAFAFVQSRGRRRLRDANTRLRDDLEIRKLTEAALRNSEARFRALLDAAPQTVIAFDPSGAIVFANQRLREMFGSSISTGGDIRNLVAERFRDTLLKTLASTGLPPSQGLEHMPDLFGLRQDGTEFPVEIRWGVVRADTELTLALISDVSGQRALRHQFLQSQKLESVGQLAGGVAHDFNNLLVVISGYAEMALSSVSPDDALHEPLHQISLAADRAANLTRQLLIFSSHRKAVPRVLSLTALLRNLEKMLSRLIAANIHLILGLDEVGPILADATQLEQVVVNLVVNARDAMPDGGRLLVETVPFPVDATYGSSHPELPPGNYAMLRVTDTGTGMTPEVQARVFEPFFTTKEQGKGTGLGLSTVYGIVRQNSGVILVYSVVGQGTVFKILFPVAGADALEQAGETAEVPRPVVKGGNRTILVAEDEGEVRRFVRVVLSANGFRVLEASNGREALAMAAGHAGPIDLLLCDLIMPQLGGREVASSIRKSHPGIAVLHMSGYSDRPLEPEIAAGLIEKPFTASALLTRIQEILPG